MAREQAIASSSAVPSPSVTELIANRSKPFMHPSTSVRNPGRKHVFLEVVVAHLTLERFAQLAFAEDDETDVRHLANDQARGLDEVALALVGNQRGDVADDRRMMGQPERLVHVDGRRRAHVIDVDAFVNGHRPFGDTPSATSIWRMASEAAMKQSTWRCFQREKELPLR